MFVNTFGDLTVFDNAANLPARDNFPINLLNNVDFCIFINVGTPLKVSNIVYGVFSCLVISSLTSANRLSTDERGIFRSGVTPVYSPPDDVYAFLPGATVIISCCP